MLRASARNRRDQRKIPGRGGLVMEKTRSADHAGRGLSEISFDQFELEMPAEADPKRKAGSDFDAIPVAFPNANAIGASFKVARGHEHLPVFIAIVRGHDNAAFDILPAAFANADAVMANHPPAMLEPHHIAHFVHRLNPDAIALGFDIFIHKNRDAFSAKGRFDPDLRGAVFINRFDPDSLGYTNFFTPNNANVNSMIGFGE
jgi:hypothetical protein